MDPALKQRMLGAAVLIVLAIIFVPMLLNGSPTTDTQTVDLTIPKTPERDFETRVMPLETPVGSSAPSAPTPDPDRVASVDASAPPRPDALAGAEPPTTHATPAPALPTPTPSTTPVASTPPVAAPTAATVANGRYFVSFGSYSKRENAQKLVDDLKRAKLAAVADSVDINGQPGLRVRAGPYADRTQAEKVRLLAKQARADVVGTVVEVDDTPNASATVAGSAKPSVGWAVQVGAFQTEADANAQRDKLRGAGFAAFVDPVRTEKATLYRVRVGPEALRANADKLRDAIQTRFQLAGLVVAHP